MEIADIVQLCSFGVGLGVAIGAMACLVGHSLFGSLDIITKI